MTLGLGTSLAVAGQVNALFFRSVPGIGDPSRLVTVTPRAVSIPGLPFEGIAEPLSRLQFLEARQRARSFQHLAAYEPFPATIQLPNEPIRLEGHLVSADYFSALGVRIIEGRAIRASDEQENSLVVVLSAAACVRLYGRTTGVVGKSLSLNNGSFTVIGVAAEEFRGVSFERSVDLWVPLEVASTVLPFSRAARTTDPNHRWLFWFLGRLNEHRTLADANGELRAISDDIASASAPTSDQAWGLEATTGVGLEPGKRSELGRLFTIIAVLVGVLLLLICINLSALQLSRVVMRWEELRLLLSLGARRFHLVAQLLADAFVLSSLSAVTALGVAILLTKWAQGSQLGLFLPAVLPWETDWRMIAVACCLMAAVVLAIGLGPALVISKSATGGMRLGSRAPGPRRHRPLGHNALVVAQVACSITLMVSAGLLIKSFQNLERVDLGFRPDGILNVRLDLDLQTLDEASGSVLYQSLLDRVRSLPQVRSASLATTVPLSRLSQRGRLAQVQTRTADALAEEAEWYHYSVISPGYFETLGIPLLRGRDFTLSDQLGSERVAIINQQMAARLRLGDSVIGARLGFGDEQITVAGVVGGVLRGQLDKAAEPGFYLPVAQHFEPQITLQVRGDRARMVSLELLRGAIRSVAPGVPIYGIHAYVDEVNVSLARPKLLSSAIGRLGALSLLIAASGLYSLLAYSVVRQTREIGIRRALGEPTVQILSRVLGRGVSAVVLGLAFGLMLTFAVVRVMRGFLFGVTVFDPTIWAQSAVILLAVAALASLIPAQTAIRIDPADSIRKQ